MASEESGSLRLTSALIAAWAIATAGLIAVMSATKLVVPELVAKAGPFLLAGYITGWLVPVATRRPKIIAAASLAFASALAWTAFGVITRAPIEKAPVLFGAGLPVMVVASLWAYFGMFLGGRRHAEPPATRSGHGDAELDDLERQLRDEISSEPAQEASVRG